MCTLLLLGKDGQVGWHLQQSLSPFTHVIALGRDEANLDNMETLRQVIQANQPDIIINAAAYTAVDHAENEPETAYRINAEAVGVIAQEALALGAWFIHYSTDYVFDGTKPGPYLETDKPNPLNHYGKSKLAGENAIHATACKHLIFRTSWVYSHRKNNFPLSILKYARERETLDIVSDQIGVPTNANLIAEVTAQAVQHIIQHKLSHENSGIYHLTPTGETTWYHFANFLIEQAHARGLPLKTLPNQVFPISHHQYNALAKRPENSLLNTDKLRGTLGINLPDWQSQVRDWFIMLCQLTTKG